MNFEFDMDGYTITIEGANGDEISLSDLYDQITVRDSASTISPFTASDTISSTADWHYYEGNVLVPVGGWNIDFGEDVVDTEPEPREPADGDIVIVDGVLL